MISFRPLRARAAGMAIILLAAVVLVSCARDKGLTVYTAASLTDAVEEVAREFEAKTGVAVSVRPGASGALTMSIENGAPADVFVSASTEWMDHLTERELVDPGTSRLLGWNRIVLVVPREKESEAPARVLDLVQLSSISMGDPDFVPAGKYAAQSLRTLEVWDSIQDRLVLAQDVRAALALVERKEVDGGLVYASDAAASKLVVTAFVLPERTHDPIVYPAVVLKNAPHPKEAARFLDFLSGPEGKDVFRSYGLGGG